VPPIGRRDLPRQHGRAPGCPIRAAEFDNGNRGQGTHHRRRGRSGNSRRTPASIRAPQGTGSRHVASPRDGERGVPPSTDRAVRAVGGAGADAVPAGEHRLRPKRGGCHLGLPCPRRHDAGPLECCCGGGRVRVHEGNHRLHRRWMALIEHSKRPVVANVAIARELGLVLVPGRHGHLTPDRPAGGQDAPQREERSAEPL